MLNNNKPKRIPSMREIFGADADSNYSRLWRDFARTMEDWGCFQNYHVSIAHFHIAFDTAKRVFGIEAALAVYQAITEDVQLKPDEILAAAKYVHGGGDKTAITELAAESYFLDLDDSPEVSVDNYLSAYEAPGMKEKDDLSR